MGILRIQTIKPRQAARLAALVESPASIGRYQNENLSFVTEADRLALSSLGFEVNLK
jgi:hypothetical protein